MLSAQIQSDAAGRGKRGKGKARDDVAQRPEVSSLAIIDHLSRFVVQSRCLEIDDWFSVSSTKESVVQKASFALCTAHVVTLGSEGPILPPLARSHKWMTATV